MAWTVPRTWVAGEVVTDAIMNAHVRDNFRALVPQHALTDASETTTSTTYTNLATVGPAVTIACTGSAYVIIGGQIWNNVSGQNALMSYVVRNSGDTADVVAANDIWCISRRIGGAGGDLFQSSYLSRQTSLGSGTFIFRAKYRVDGGGATGTFFHRWIIVIPIGLAA